MVSMLCYSFTQESLRYPLMVWQLDKMNPFVYCSKTRPGIGKASSASQPPNSRQNDECCKCRLQNDRLKKLRQQAAKPAKIPF